MAPQNDSKVGLQLGELWLMDTYGRYIYPAKISQFTNCYNAIWLGVIPLAAWFQIDISCW